MQIADFLGKKINEIVVFLKGINWLYSVYQISECTRKALIPLLEIS